MDKISMFLGWFLVFLSIILLKVQRTKCYMKSDFIIYSNVIALLMKRNQTKSIV